MQHHIMYPTLLSLAVVASASTLVLSAPTPSRQLERDDLAAYGERLIAARALNNGQDLSLVEKRQLLCSTLGIGCDHSPNTDSTGYAPWNVGCPDPWVWLRPAAVSRAPRP